MSLFKNLDGIVGSLFRFAGPTGNGIKAESYGLSVRDSAGSVLKRLAIGRASADIDGSSYLDLKERAILIEFSFSGSSAPSPGTNTGSYGFCHTTGGAYTAGSIYYDDGTTTLSTNVVTSYKRQVLITTSAVTGTVSLVANGVYMAQTNSAPFTWTLKGDGAPSATGLIKSIKIPLGISTPVDSTTSIPANSEIIDAILDVTTAYSVGTNIELRINGSTPVTVLATTENAPTSIAMYSKDQRTVIGASNAGVLRAVISGGPAVGVGVAVVRYLEAYLS